MESIRNSSQCGVNGLISSQCGGKLLVCPTEVIWK
jgi:hypothetical protein